MSTRPNQDDLELMEKLVWKLAEFQFNTLSGFERAEKQIKETGNNLRRQAIELKKSYKKGKSFKVHLPSLLAIREEEGKDDDVKYELPGKATAQKASEVTVQKKLGRPRKRKSSHSPNSQLSKNIKGDTTQVLHKSVTGSDPKLNDVKLNGTESTHSDHQNEEKKITTTECELLNDHTVVENENQEQNENKNDRKEDMIGKKESNLERIKTTTVDSSLHKSNKNSDQKTAFQSVNENQQSSNDDNSLPLEKRATHSTTANPNPEVEDTRIPFSSESEALPETPYHFVQPEVPKKDEVPPTDFKSPELPIVSEVRCTRSKMAKQKPKPGDADVVRSESSSSEEVISSPEKRCTRSKMAKQKPIPDTDEVRSEPLSSEGVSSSEKRCTRSKMAKSKAKVDAEFNGTDDECDMEKDASPHFQAEKLNPKQRIKVKDMKEIFTPGFRKAQEKENFLSFYKSTEKKPLGKYTPLQIKNTLVTPSKIPLISSGVKTKNNLGEAERRKKEEESQKKRQKEEEALRKKQEMVKAKQEDFRRKNEEKMLKAAAARIAAEKEKSEYLMKMEKEREEREKATKELLERKKEEVVIKKKMAHMTKAMEAEQRRLKEEAARQAKIKEMEMEQRQQEELRLKQQEETERIMKQRQEELRVKEAAMKAMQKKKPNIIPLKDKENLDINDLDADDDEDEDDDFANKASVKKEIPEWARKKEEKLRQDRVHILVPMDLLLQYFAYPSQTPDLTELFGKMAMKRFRSSSAVWLDTPPLKK